jgi:hypothetical protein
VQAFQTSYTNDVNGNTLTTVTRTWDVPSTSWKDFSRSNYDNNPDGTANIVTNQQWSGSTWNDASRVTYTYDASKRIKTSITETWLGMWMYGTKLINTYDGSGYLTYDKSQQWDIISSSWKDKTQTTYTNNSNGNPTLEVTQTWDGVSTWNNTQRTTSTYNGSNKILTAASDNWVSGNWQADSRETYTYNVSGYVVLYESYDVGTSSWKNKNQSTYSINPNGTLSQITMQDWDGISAWVNTQRITFTYSPSTYISESVKEADFTIYPNPAYNVITIKANSSTTGSTYSITDQSGKLLLKGKLLDETTSVDITGLTNGIYFLVIGEKSKHTFKVIKQDLK